LDLLGRIPDYLNMPKSYPQATWHYVFPEVHGQPKFLLIRSCRDQAPCLIAIVKPAQSDEYHVAQSKHEILPQIPFRMIVAGPSGGGKTALLQSMMLSLYKTKSGKCPLSVYVSGLLVLTLIQLGSLSNDIFAKK
jgi:hypothetical protein